MIPWVELNAGAIKALLEKNGALLIRSLDIQGSKKLEKALEKIFSAQLLEYTYRSTPRTKMRGRIYTSTEYHADEVILLHNENAYSNRWPLKIAFYCVKSSDEGGATPIADSRVIYSEIPEEIKTEFERKKLMYVRNYSEIDLPWTDVFQTEDQTVVNAYCELNHIDYEWSDGNKLRTRQINPAMAVHPVTGDRLWFNQAHLFHISSQQTQVRESLINTFGKEGLPRNVYFADSSDIPEDIIATIREVYEKNSIIFSWQDGDLLLLDNMLFAHGRQSYKGKRKILTATATAVSLP